MEAAEEILKRIKRHRLDLDQVLQRMKADSRKSRESSLAITNLQQAIMWLGMDLKELAGGQSCYAHGYDPSSSQVDRPTDVKL